MGLAMFIYGFVPMSVVAFLPFFNLTLAEAGTFAVVFLASGELSFYGAVVLLGKEFVTVLKKRVLALLHRHHQEPKPVSRTRHRAGVVLFAASFLPYYIVLVDLVFFAPKGAEITFLAWVMVAGEVAGIVALFLLGGQFWERLKQLFSWPGDEVALAGEAR